MKTIRGGADVNDELLLLYLQGAGYVPVDKEMHMAEIIIAAVSLFVGLGGGAFLGVKYGRQAEKAAADVRTWKKK